MFNALLTITFVVYISFLVAFGFNASRVRSTLLRAGRKGVFSALTLVSSTPSYQTRTLYRIV